MSQLGKMHDPPPPQLSEIQKNEALHNAATKW